MNTKYRLVTNAEELQHAVDELSTKHAIGLDTEPTDLAPYTARLRLLQLAARDAAVLIPLRDKLIERIKSLDLVRCAQLEFECVMPVVDLELAGFYMNKERWLEQLAIVEEKRAELANELQEMLGEGAAQASLFGPPRANINLDSQQQVTEALNRLGIPLPDSTRNWKLQPLATQYPVVAKLLEYRTMQKALTSYGENMIELINPMM